MPVGVAPTQAFFQCGSPYWRHEPATTPPQVSVLPGSRTRSCPAGYLPAVPKKPSTAPAATTSTISLPGGLRNPRQTYEHDHLVVGVVEAGQDADRFCSQLIAVVIRSAHLHRPASRTRRRLPPLTRGVRRH